LKVCELDRSGLVSCPIAGIVISCVPSVRILFRAYNASAVINGFRSMAGRKVNLAIHGFPSKFIRNNTHILRYIYNKTQYLKRELKRCTNLVECSMRHLALLGQRWTGHYVSRFRNIKSEHNILEGEPWETSILKAEKNILVM
jgi:hypothetical protein